MMYLRAQSCGISQIITKETELDRSDFIVAEQIYPEDENGTALSVYGWIQLTDEDQRDHPLFRLKFIPNVEEEAAVTFENVFSVSYDNTDEENSQLKFKFAKTSEEFGEETEAIKLPLNKWLFWAVSFDYSQKVMKFHITGADVSTNKTFETDFEGFKVQKKLLMDLGCFPTEEANEDQDLKVEVLETCTKGKLQTHSHIAEYFEEPD